MRKLASGFGYEKISYDIRDFSGGFFLVFLHGTGGNLTAWKKARDFFHKKKVSTIAIDLRGHGKSSRPKGINDYSLDNFAKDVDLILEKEKINDFAIIGHCFGGIVAMHYECLFNKKSRALVIISSTYKCPRPVELALRIMPLNRINGIKIGNDFDSLLKDYSKIENAKDWDAKRIYSDIKSTTFRSWVFSFNSLKDFDAKKILSKIKKPALVICGDKDSVISPKDSIMISKMIKNSKFEIIKGENHIIIMNNPKIIYERISDFLNKKNLF